MLEVGVNGVETGLRAAAGGIETGFNAAVGGVTTGFNASVGFVGQHAPNVAETAAGAVADGAKAVFNFFGNL